MDTYLFSIQPKWCEKIFNGEKTIEIRKTAPKPPFKVVVYCTKGNGILTRYLHGKVIGEFVCNEVDKYKYEKTKEGVGKFTISEKDFKDMAIDGFDLFDYADGKDIYGIHITDLKVYDEPKALHHFFKPCGDCSKKDTMRCTEESTDCRATTITRPPQSYMRIQCTEED